jgi:hypothetical protein
MLKFCQEQMSSQDARKLLILNSRPFFVEMAGAGPSVNGLQTEVMF